MFAIAMDRSVLGGWLEERKRRGLDRRDEVWDGVLHMVPEPAFHHNSIVFGLARAIGTVALRHDLGEAGKTNVRAPGTGDQNYRVPDLIFVKKNGVTRFADGDDVWIEQGPDLVVEVLSPRDKLPFYAARGVPEVLFLEGETARPQLLRLVGEGYVAAGTDAEGGLKLECLGSRLFFEPGATALARGKLTLRDDRTGETHPA